MRKLRILLVEDDVWIGSLLAEMLQAEGHVICGIEATEAGAVQAALTDPPDLIIADAHLHHGSGIGAIETISRSADVPHIVMSGSPLLETNPASMFLRKPFPFCDLLAMVETAACSLPR